MNFKKNVTTSQVFQSLIMPLFYVFFPNTNGTPINMNTFLICGVLFIISLLIINYQQPLRHIFVGGWKIKKKWKSIWMYSKNGSDLIVEDGIKLHQIGSYVYGRGISNRVEGNYAFPQARYTIAGYINKEGLFTAEWKSMVSPNYYGVCFLQCSRDGLKMAGHWIGIGNNSINIGNWDWDADTTEEGFDDD